MRRANRRTGAENPGRPSLRNRQVTHLPKMQNYTIIPHRKAPHTGKRRPTPFWPGRSRLSRTPSRVAVRTQPQRERRFRRLRLMGKHVASTGRHATPTKKHAATTERQATTTRRHAVLSTPGPEKKGPVPLRPTPSPDVSISQQKNTQCLSQKTARRTFFSFRRHRTTGHGKKFASPLSGHAFTGFPVRPRHAAFRTTQKSGQASDKRMLGHLALRKG